MSSVVSDVYDSSAALGRFESTVGLFIGIAVAVVLFISASYFYMQKETFSKVSADIIHVSNCTPHVVGKSTTYNCNINVQYVVNGIKYSGNVTTSSSKNWTGATTIDVYYNPTNPHEVKYQEMTSQQTATFSVISGCCAIVITGCIYYITHTFKFAAASTGIGSIINVGEKVF